MQISIFLVTDHLYNHATCSAVLWSLGTAEKSGDVAAQNILRLFGGPFASARVGHRTERARRLWHDVFGEIDMREPGRIR